jgi:hypothetical protein
LIKASTILVASPDEILRALLDPQQRLLWDHNIKSARFNEETKEMLISYSNSVPGSALGLFETIKF